VRKATGATRKTRKGTIPYRSTSRNIDVVSNRVPASAAEATA
jgi:hypothetical protein